MRSLAANSRCYFCSEVWWSFASISNDKQRHRKKADPLLGFQQCAYLGRVEAASGSLRVAAGGRA